MCFNAFGPLHCEPSEAPRQSHQNPRDLRRGGFSLPERNTPMLVLTTREAVTDALLDTTLDASLRALIGLRAWQ